jgi:hypothetical protein
VLKLPPENKPQNVVKQFKKPNKKANMEIKLLDDILKYLLYIQKAEKPYHVGNNEIDSSFLNIEKNLFKSAILKLKNDNYIYFGNNVELKNINNFHIAGLVDLTLDGILFINSGGYQNHYNKLQIEQNLMSDLKSEQRRHSTALVNLNRWMVGLTIVVALGTLIAGLYYILEILAFFGVLTSQKN